MQLQVVDLGLQPYAEVLSQMQQYTKQRTFDTCDQIWRVQHPAVYTTGQAGRIDDLPTTSSVPVIKTDRGGQITYHGPGQVIFYILINLPRSNLKLKQLINILQQSVIEVLANFNITGTLIPNLPGVYVDGKKIAQLGLRVAKGCSYHGISFNIDMDLQPLTAIKICGIKDMQPTQLAEYIKINPATSQNNNYINNNSVINPGITTLNAVANIWQALLLQALSASNPIQ